MIFNGGNSLGLGRVVWPFCAQSSSHLECLSVHLQTDGHGSQIVCLGFFPATTPHANTLTKTHIQMAMETLPGPGLVVQLFFLL